MVYGCLFFSAVHWPRWKFQCRKEMKTLSRIWIAERSRNGEIGWERKKKYITLLVCFVSPNLIIVAEIWWETNSLAYVTIQKGLLHRYVLWVCVFRRIGRNDYFVLERYPFKKEKENIWVVIFRVRGYWLMNIIDRWRWTYGDTETSSMPASDERNYLLINCCLLCLF